MARTNVAAILLSPGQTEADAAEVATAIDAANGMRVTTTSPKRDVVLRVTNTHASAHAVTLVAAPGAGNPRGVHGAAGPGGSSPSEPDSVSATIAATSGVRYVAVGWRHFQSDGSIWLNFEALHAGVITAVERA